MLIENVAAERAPAPKADRCAAPNIIVLSDGRAGNDNHSLGVAAALGAPTPTVIRFDLKKHGLAQWLPVPWVYGHGALTSVPAADILIGTGWQMSRISRWLWRQRAASARPVFSVQLLRPCGRPSDYDIVALPWHDLQRPFTRRWRGTADNVAVTAGAVNTITLAKIADAAATWQERLRHLPTPRLAVLVGGDSRHGPLPFRQTLALVDSLTAWAKESGGSLMITTSRRSGAPISDLIVTLLNGRQKLPYAFWRPDDPACGENPYLGFLAHADAVVATDDSISMVSEGMTAGRPVYLFGDEARVPVKFRAFFARMEREGRLARWRGSLTLTTPADVLDDAALIAGAVHARRRDARRSVAALPLGLRVFFINLDASVKRRTYMETALRGTGLPFERVPGIAGAALPSALKSYFCTPTGRIASRLTLGEVGCHAAHLAACQHFLASAATGSAQVALVLEDDAHLPADLASVLAGILARLPADWDIVRLSNIPKRAYVPVGQIDGRHRLVKYSKVPSCSIAYLINAGGARKLLAPGLRSHSIDIYLRRPWLAGLQTYGVVPAPIRIAEFPSDIDALQHRDRRRQAVFRWAARMDLSHLPGRLIFEIKWLGFMKWLLCLLINAADKVPTRLFNDTLIHRFSDKLQIKTMR